MRPLGWRYESHRHALAARGISTKYYAGKRSQLAGTNAPEFVRSFRGSDLVEIEKDGKRMAMVISHPNLPERKRLGQAMKLAAVLSPDEAEALGRTYRELREDGNPAVKGVSEAEFVRRYAGDRKSVV